MISKMTNKYKTNLESTLPISLCGSFFSSLWFGPNWAKIIKPGTKLGPYSHAQFTDMLENVMKSELYLGAAGGSLK